MVLRIIRVIRVAVVVCFIGSASGFAQQEASQKIAPVGESFTISMPTQAVEASRRIPLNDKDSIRERVYSSLAGGKRYMLIAFMKTSPERVPALSSFDNFMHGMEQSFRSVESEVSKSLTFDRDLSDDSG